MGRRKSGDQSRRPSLLSVKGLTSSGNQGGVSRASARGTASRSLSTPLNYKLAGRGEGAGPSRPGRSSTTSPLTSSSDIPKEYDPFEEDADGLPPISSPGGMMMLFPGAHHRSPSEEALLYHLEYDTKREGREELTLRTFSEGDRGLGRGSQLQKEDRGDGLSRQKPSEAIGMRPPGPSGDEDPGEDLSKSLGRRSMDTFITARATLGVDMEKDKPAGPDSVMLEDNETNAEPMLVDDAQAAVEQSESSPAVKPEVMDAGTPPTARMIWRLGSWVYESLPSIRGALASGSAASPAAEVGPKEPADVIFRDHGVNPVDEPPPEANAESTPDVADMPVVVLSSGDISVAEVPSTRDQSSGWMGSMYLWRGSKKETVTSSPAKVDIASDVVESNGTPIALNKLNEQPTTGSREAPIAPATDQSPTEHVPVVLTELVRTKRADLDKMAPAETTPTGQTWASRFRSSLVRDPVIDAPIQPAAAAGRSPLPDTSGSQPSTGATHAADKTLQSDPAPAGLSAPDGLDANRNPESAPTSSSWWFGRRTNGVATAGGQSASVASESRMADTFERVTDGTVVTPPLSQSLAQHEKESEILMPASARMDRRASAIIRKNQILPSWNSTFHRPPRSTPSMDGAPGELDGLPRLELDNRNCWKGIRRVVVIGIHGWFPNTHIQKCVQISSKCTAPSSDLAGLPP